MKSKPIYKAIQTKSIKQLILNLALYSLLYLVALQFISTSFPLFALAIVLLPFLMIRLFIIQHDCTHYAFWTSSKANNLTGILLGSLTHVPHQYWSKMHRQHHGTSGNLDKREYGDIWTLTVSEYEQSSALDKFKYRCYRSPLILLLLGGMYLFFIRLKNPLAPSGLEHKAYTSILITNALIVIRMLILCYFFSWQSVLLIEILALYIGSIVGVALFYLQHNYADAYWQDNVNWDYQTAAWQGSSFLDLGKIFHWLTGNIGYHHIHHFDPRVPNYLLAKADREAFSNERVVTLKYKDIVPSFQLKLWDEKKQSLVKF